MLGAHPAPGGVVVRVWRPEARAVRVYPDGGPPVELAHRASALFEAVIEGATAPLAYEVEVEYDTYSVHGRDPYAFLPTIGELDLHLLGEGRHEELWERLGAHLREIDGVAGVAFAVWAPSARSVSVVGDWNGWDGRVHPMRSLGSSGIWELFVPGVGPDGHYKFEIRGADGALRLQGRPARRRRRDPAANGLGGLRAPSRVARRRLARGRGPSAPRTPSRCRSTRCTCPPGGSTRWRATAR